MISMMDSLQYHPEYFKGIPVSAFDPKGNLTVGIKEHIVFPEMIGEDVRSIFGLEVSIVTTAKSREEGVSLLKHLGFPIQEKSRGEEIVSNGRGRFRRHP